MTTRKRKRRSRTSKTIGHAGRVAIRREFRPGRKPYSIRWTVRGAKGDQKKQPGASFNTLADAKVAAELQNETLRQESLGRCTTDPLDVPLAGLLDDYARWKVGAGISRKQLRAIRDVCAAVFGWLNWHKVADVNRRGIERYLDHLRDDYERSAETQNKHLGVVQGLLAWATREDRIPRNPLQGLRKRKGPKVRVRQVFARPVQAAIFRAARRGPSWQPVAVALGYYAALRLREVRELVWARVHFDRDLLEFRPEDQKNKKHSYVPISPELMRILRDRKREEATAEAPDRVLPGMPDEPSAAQRSMLKRAGVPYKDSFGHVGDFHAFRHTRLTHLAEDEVPLAVLQDFARHATPMQTRAYVRENEAAVHRALARSAKKAMKRKKGRR